eukprot:TRINITY_DN9931_c0_g1_i1.p1 TRINITY_DN9931_c0_g1~~TRINITY_DN9931_c0_g1_i1.p1  ORF type:complete len:364 (+),score=177.41 TRINITY_DN9931_c0_g1_i1:50-1093(+)
MVKRKQLDNDVGLLKILKSATSLYFFCYRCNVQKRGTTHALWETSQGQKFVCNGCCEELLAKRKRQKTGRIGIRNKRKELRGPENSDDEETKEEEKFNSSIYRFVRHPSLDCLSDSIGKISAADSDCAPLQKAMDTFVAELADIKPETSFHFMEIFDKIEAISGAPTKTHSIKDVKQLERYAQIVKILAEQPDREMLLPYQRRRLTTELHTIKKLQDKDARLSTLKTEIHHPASLKKVRGSLLSSEREFDDLVPIVVESEIMGIGTSRDSLMRWTVIAQFGKAIKQFGKKLPITSLAILKTYLSKVIATGIVEEGPNPMGFTKDQIAQVEAIRDELLLLVAAYYENV